MAGRKPKMTFEEAALAEARRRVEYRHGKKALSVWLDPELIKKFKVIGAAQGKTNEKLMIEAIGLLIEKYKEEKGE